MVSAQYVAFYPDLPHPRTTIVKILEHLCLSYEAKLGLGAMCAFKWRDTTIYHLDESVRLKFPAILFINGRCADISKVTIARIYAEIFGWELSVNPLNFSGMMVCKSDRNAAHDGQVVQGPLAVTSPGKTYSILIDNSHQGEIIDYRVPVFGGVIPFVYIKRRPIEERFSNRNSSVALSDTTQLFAPNECELIKAFAKALGMDFGELDVLRDNRTGRLSIVDASNTPFGPPNGLSSDDSDLAITLLSKAFREAFLPHLGQSSELGARAERCQ